MSMLVVVAHSDDETLGCGATIAKLKDVHCLILGSGTLELRNETGEAKEILGIKELVFRDFPDNRFDTVPLLEIVREIERIKNRIKPDVIYTHYRGDLNIDHQITFRATLTACRPINGETVKEIYSFEVPSSTEWGLTQFSPNTFVDVADTLDRKVEALGAYKSQIKAYPHPRSPGSLKAIAMKWGSTVGCGVAEAFVLVRCIK